MSITNPNQPPKYKYLKYLPTPILIEPSMYDLVDDDEFFTYDERIPLLMATQFGIFPFQGCYQGKPTYELRTLEGLEHRKVAFFKRGYASNSESPGISILLADEQLLDQLNKRPTSIRALMDNGHNKVY